MSSTQPISTTLWPSTGSRPVVSVSSTISRMVLFLPAPLQCRDHGLHLRESMVETLVGLNHEMGFCTLFGIGHLTRQDMIELVRRHPGPRQNARALHVMRRRHHHH